MKHILIGGESFETINMADTNSGDKLDGCVGSKESKPDTNGKTIEPAEEEKPKEKKDSTEEDKNNNETEDGEEHEPELYFTPKVHLPIVVINTMEDNEDVVVELRSRIYRYNISEDGEMEFRERGTGVLKLLKHQKVDTYRVVMRRDKTLKICANHQVTTAMDIVYHRQNKRVLLYSTLADFYDDEISPQTFAIRFSNAEEATIFKNAFEEAVKELKRIEKEKKKAGDELSSTLEKIDIKAEDEDK